ncbi:MAG: DUF11 domain-containing protein, partial [Caldilineaceae bacterium]|nr:DUF11 domain-containing protein [Caldilineaceae bacterium]
GVTSTVLTDANGIYTATVPTGSTTVDVDNSTLPAGMVQTGGIDPSPVTVVPGPNDAGNDGYQAQAILTGVVYQDTNGNGTQDPGEPGLPGITMVITDSLGATQTQLTDANGIYTATVPTGSTTVDVDNSTLPAGMVQTGGVDPSPVNVAPGLNDAGSDGFQAQGTLMGVVYQDTNGNGAQDPGEPGLPGVTVIITDSLGVMRTVLTDASGIYTATVPTGSTTIDVDNSTLPGGMVQTGGVDPNPFTVVPGPNDAGRDGYRLQGTLAGLIYQDTNGNGTQDPGEPGLPGVTVIITDSLGITHTALTDANGIYTATMPTGSTTVDVDNTTLPAGMVQTDGVDPSPLTVVLGPNDAGRDGYQPPAEIFDLSLRKRLLVNSGTIFVEGDDVRFVIEVFNQGTIAAQNIVVVDYIPAGMSLSPTNTAGWQMDGNLARATIAGPLSPNQAATIEIVLRVGDAFAQVVNGAEIAAAQETNGQLRADADATNDAINGNDPVIDNALDGSGPDDEDDHDIEPFYVERVDAALLKRLADGQLTTVTQGADIRYTIVVTNQGSIPFGTILVQDRIPEGFSLSPNDTNGWSVSADGRLATKTIQGPLGSGAAIAVDIVLRAGQPPAGMVRNHAEIIGLNDMEDRELGDADSNPNNNVADEDDQGAIDIEVTIPPPTAVTLASFDAVWSNGAMVVRWATSFELDIAGYRLYRSVDEQLDHAIQMTAHTIPGVGTNGGSYEFVDGEVVEGQTYWYWLAEVKRSGQLEYYGPLRALAGPAAPAPEVNGRIFLPIVTR